MIENYFVRHDYFKTKLGSGSGVPSYGTLVTQYETDVVTAGGTVSTAAKDALQSLFYDSYDNGDSGTGSVNDFISAFDFIWTPISDDFNGALVCVTGSIDSNNGFVSGDYSQSVSLTGDGTSYLITSLNLADMDIEDNSVFFGVDIDTTVQEHIISRVGTGAEFFDIRYTTGSSTMQVRYRDSSGLVRSSNYLGVSGTFNGVLGMLTDGVNRRTYSGLTNLVSQSLFNDPLTGTDKPVGLYGRVSIDGTSASSVTNATIRSMFVGRALTEPERNVLTRALIQFDTDRSNL